MKWTELYDKVSARHGNLSDRERELITTAVTTFKSDIDDQPLEDLAKEIYIHTINNERYCIDIARDSIKAAEIFMEAWKNHNSKNEDRYYVIKDGRSVSDYDNREEALRHAQRIGGTIATSK